MKKLILILAALICMASNALAIPSLQLDIGGGYYDNSSQTIIANSSSFTLYVLLNDAALLDQMFYLSAAVMPKTRTSADLGSFTFDGQQVEVTKDMVYGTPQLPWRILTFRHTVYSRHSTRSLVLTSKMLKR